MKSVLKRLALAATTAMVLAVAACAQTQAIEETTAPSAVAQTPSSAAQAPGGVSPALWVVRDADSTIYLYGTIHLRRAGEDWANDRVRNALRSSDEVWTELEIPETPDPAMQQLVMRLGIAPTGQGLSTHLTPEQNARLGKALEGLGIPPAAFQPFQPWLAAITISVTQMTQAGYDPNAGVDQGVVAAARAANRRLRWFESAEQQLSFMAGLSMPVQVQLLNDTVDEIDEGVALLDRMDSAWSRGDMAALETDMIIEMQQRYPELYDALLTRRNAAWVETLSTELAGSGTDFVAVGVGHLVGPDSVIAMLAARGITAERLQ
jgi:uncharacterized protein